MACSRGLFFFFLYRFRAKFKYQERRTKATDLFKFDKKIKKTLEFLTWDSNQIQMCRLQLMADTQFRWHQNFIQEKQKKENENEKQSMFSWPQLRNSFNDIYIFFFAKIASAICIHKTHLVMVNFLSLTNLFIFVNYSIC